jgi:hypothetical protein
VDTPPRVRERALEYIARSERTDAVSAIGFDTQQTARA